MAFPTKLILVFLTAFIDMLGFSFVLPIISFLTKELNGSTFELGLLVGCYAFAQAISALYMGYFSDRYGRKPFLILSLCGSFIGPILQALSPTMVILVITRTLTGLFAGSMVLAQAYITDCIPREERTTYLSIFGGVISAAFAFGPALGGFLGEISLRAPFYVAGILAGIVLLVSIFFMKESLPSIVNKEKKLVNTKITTEKNTQDKPKPKTKLHFNVIMIFALILRFLNDSCIVISDSMYGYYLQDTINVSSLNYSIMLCITGCLSAFVQFYLLPVLHDKAHIPLTILTLFGSILLCIGYICMTFLHSYIGAFISIGVMFMGSSFLATATPSMLSAQSPSEVQGQALSIGSMVGQVAMIITSPILGIVYEYTKWGTIFVGAVYGAIAIVLLLILLCIPNGLHADVNPHYSHGESEDKSVSSLTKEDISGDNGTFVGREEEEEKKKNINMNISIDIQEETKDQLMTNTQIDDATSVRNSQNSISPLTRDLETGETISVSPM
ncbi:hypothetical protein WA158_006574 [Blastocystis sp. Blastoise]